MTEQEKAIQFDLESARRIGKTVEFLATFGAIFILNFIFGTFLIPFLGGVVAYGIVNGVLEINLKRIKEKLNI